MNQIKSPTLFICGRDDEATPESLQIFKSKIPGAEIRVIENSAHCTFIDAKEESYKIIADFLNKHE